MDSCRLCSPPCGGCLSAAVAVTVIETKAQSDPLGRPPVEDRPGPPGLRRTARLASVRLPPQLPQTVRRKRQKRTLPVLEAGIGKRALAGRAPSEDQREHLRPRPLSRPLTLRWPSCCPWACGTAPPTPASVFTCCPLAGPYLCEDTGQAACRARAIPVGSRFDQYVSPDPVSKAGRAPRSRGLELGCRNLGWGGGYNSTCSSPYVVGNCRNFIGLLVER